MDPVAVVRSALEGTGINLFGSFGVEAYDRVAPAGMRAADLMPRALGMIVAGSAGPALWAGLKASSANGTSPWSIPHPLDAHVGDLLSRADEALAMARVGSRRFEPTLGAIPSLDFRLLGELAGLGSMGPFGLLIHEVHGPWWAMRGAWMVDASVPAPTRHLPPCGGCAAPCVGDARHSGLFLATAAVRGRCVVGQASRYSDEQIAYHYDREETLDKLRESSAPKMGS